MNRFEATVTAIEEASPLHLISFDAGGTALKMLLLTEGSALRRGAKATLGIEPAMITLIKGCEGAIGCANLLHATITGITHGTLLCTVSLQIESLKLEATLLEHEAQSLHLQTGTSVTAMLRASDLYIVEFGDG